MEEQNYYQITVSHETEPENEKSKPKQQKIVFVVKAIGLTDIETKIAQYMSGDSMRRDYNIVNTKLIKGFEAYIE